MAWGGESGRFAYSYGSRWTIYRIPFPQGAAHLYQWYCYNAGIFRQHWTLFDTCHCCWKHIHAFQPSVNAVPGQSMLFEFNQFCSVPNALLIRAVWFQVVVPPQPAALYRWKSCEMKPATKMFFYSWVAVDADTTIHANPNWYNLNRIMSSVVHIPMNEEQADGEDERAWGRFAQVLLLFQCTPRVDPPLHLHTHSLSSPHSLHTSTPHLPSPFSMVMWLNKRWPWLLCSTIGWLERCTLSWSAPLWSSRGALRGPQAMASFQSNRYLALFTWCQTFLMKASHGLSTWTFGEVMVCATALISPVCGE